MPTSPALIETPTGYYTLPLVRCAQLVASSATVQAMLGVATSADALDRIDYPTRDVETYGEPIPGIILEGRKQRRTYSGDQRGEIEIALYDEIDADYAINSVQTLDFKNDQCAWLNRVGAIAGELLVAAKQPMSDFGGQRFDLLSVADLIYPVHMYDALADGTDPRWFRFALLLLEWTT